MVRFLGKQQHRAGHLGCQRNILPDLTAFDVCHRICVRQAHGHRCIVLERLDVLDEGKALLEALLDIVHRLVGGNVEEWAEPLVSGEEEPCHVEDICAVRTALDNRHIRKNCPRVAAGKGFLHQSGVGKTVVTEFPELYGAVCLGEGDAGKFVFRSYHSVLVVADGTYRSAHHEVPSQKGIVNLEINLALLEVHGQEAFLLLAFLPEEFLVLVFLPGGVLLLHSGLGLFPERPYSLLRCIREGCKAEEQKCNQE